MDNQALELCAGVKRLRDGKYSDFVITCNAREWKVHKIVLTAISSVLEKSCFGPFKESIESRIDLSVYSEEEVDALVSYIYTGGYKTSPAVDCSDLGFHVKMCIIGNYFSIAGLEKLAMDEAKICLYHADVQQMVEAATLMASAPGPTNKMQPSILRWAARCAGLYKGKVSPFLQIMVVNAELGTAIAKDERERAAAAVTAALQAARSETEQMVCPKSTCRKTFHTLRSDTDTLSAGSQALVTCCYCNYRGLAKYFRHESSKTTEPSQYKKRRRS